MRRSLHHDKVIRSLRDHSADQKDHHVLCPKVYIIARAKTVAADKVGPLFSITGWSKPRQICNKIFLRHSLLIAAVPTSLASTVVLDISTL
jgi:hypothetical protein